MRRAVIVASFGTSYRDALENGIAPIEDAIRDALPEYEVVRAFTSRKIIKKLAGEGVVITTPHEAKAALEREGIALEAVVSTHMIGGFEYDRLCSEMRGCKVTEPLLSRDEDLVQIRDLLAKSADETEGTLLLMGHGTEHTANCTYTALRELLPENVLLACAEGEHTLDTVLDRLKLKCHLPVTLMPLMIVAGDHARNDLAGPDADSWASRLNALGYDVRLQLRGLGSQEVVQRMFVEKLKRVLPDE